MPHPVAAAFTGRNVAHVLIDPDAVCASSDADWHADKARDRLELAALCLTCPLVIQCATAALVNYERFGVWGGIDFDEATRLAAKRARAQRDRARRARPRPVPRAVAACGSHSGYKRHVRLEEPACPACLAAERERSAVRREARSRVAAAAVRAKAAQSAAERRARIVSTVHTATALEAATAALAHDRRPVTA